ncbi:MAG: AMP-binding protein [Candidatus Schekmanbacteria bacterium]|nr:AMP-binding protein [Candidatus Schekmanbacteria bacterium]
MARLPAALTHRLGDLALARRVLGAAAFSLGLEWQAGELGATLAAARRRGTLAFARDWTFAELLEWAARRFGGNPFIDFAGDCLSFDLLNRRANQVARGLQAHGAAAGAGVAIMMDNRPSFLELFFASQKVGAYCVPINTHLVGDGLAYIVNHSEVAIVGADGPALDKLRAIADRLARPLTVFVVDDDGGGDRESLAAMPPSARLRLLPYAELERRERCDADLGTRPDAHAPSLLMYTSGTTGLPKAVVYRSGSAGVKKLGFASHVFYDPDDKIYTCLPLFHANALLVTVVQALWRGIPVALARRFRASRFWREVSESGATTFNALGAMIPILLKTPPSVFEREHRVRKVISSACPADAWRPFEERFGVRIWEAYGAVDGGGFVVFNAGNAPVGSIGRPSFGARYRLVTASGADAAVGEAGELMFHAARSADAPVTYYKNEAASADKTRDGWLRTGDVMRRDAGGFLYFVGRRTDSMRRRGENVSAYEVEKEVDAHPDVLESAAFGVPSELAEEEIMVCVVPVEGRTVDPQALAAFLAPRLPKYALPRYVEVVDALPKTATHRVMKEELKARGVTPRTVDLQR